MLAKYFATEGSRSWYGLIDRTAALHRGQLWETGSAPHQWLRCPVTQAGQTSRIALRADHLKVGVLRVRHPVYGSVALLPHLQAAALSEGPAWPCKRLSRQYQAVLGTRPSKEHCPAQVRRKASLKPSRSDAQTRVHACGTEADDVGEPGGCAAPGERLRRHLRLAHRDDMDARAALVAGHQRQVRRRQIQQPQHLTQMSESQPISPGQQPSMHAPRLSLTTSAMSATGRPMAPARAPYPTLLRWVRLSRCHCYSTVRVSGR